MQKKNRLTVAGLAVLLMAGVLNAAGGKDLSAQMIAGVESYVQAARELNVAMMMIEKGKKEKDARVAAYHALEGIGRLEEICQKMAKAHGGLRALEEQMFTRYRGRDHSEYQYMSGPAVSPPVDIDVWSPDDWVTQKALEGLPELANAAKQFFAGQRLKLKIYATYLVTHACPKSGHNGSHETCYDPKGGRICCHLKCLVNIMNMIFDPPITPTGEDLCYDDTEFKVNKAKEINEFIDDLTLPELKRVCRDLATCDLYWAEKQKVDIVVASGDFTKAGGWDYLNTVKDTFFEGFSSAWDKLTTVGGAVTTVASGDYSGGMAMVDARGPALSLAAWPEPAGPREGIAILAPKDKKKAPCLLARVIFQDGRAVIPHTLQGPFTLYLYMPGYRPLIHKNLVVTEEQQTVPIQVVPSGAPATALSLASDWNPQKESTLEVPPVPPCDISQEVYHVEHVGELDAENQAYRTRLRMHASFDLVFGPDEREIEKVVTYQVEHETAGKASGSLNISISPVSYTLEATVKWTASLEYKDGKKHLAMDVEVLDRGRQKLHWRVSDGPGEPLVYDTQQDCLIDPVIVFSALDTRPDKDDQVQSAGENAWFWEIHQEFPLMVTPGGGPARHQGASIIRSRVDITSQSE